jgi:hypothetical protein
MIKKSLAFALAFSFLLSANFLAQEIKWTQDKFDGSTMATLTCDNPKLEGGSYMSSRYLIMRLVATSGENPLYAIKLIVSRPDWMFIQSGESLILKVDDRFINLSGPGSDGHREIVSGHLIIETAVYPLTPRQVKILGGAIAIEFRLLGDRESITGRFPWTVIRDFHTFYDQVVLKFEADKSSQQTTIR